MPLRSQIPVVAYFSMEVGLEPAMPTYASGLGVLAGDTLRAAADLGVPMLGVSLLHRQGYFRQQLDARGNQSEGRTTGPPSSSWSPWSRASPSPSKAGLFRCGPGATSSAG